jgi:tetratricopeptide (TPR) repeat protein
MSTSSSDPASPQNLPPRRGRRYIFLLLALLAVAVAGGSAWWWHWKDSVHLPTVDLTNADPEVAEAIKSATDDVRRAPRSATAWGKLGKVLAAHRYFDAADDCFVEAERLQPHEPRWPLFRGLTLIFRDPDAAIAEFQHSLKLRPDEPAVRLRLADALAAQGRLDGAEAEYRWLLQDDTLAPRAQLGLGRLAYQRGDLAAARRYLGQCATHPLSRKEAHALLAEVEQRSNDPSAASRERGIASDLPDDQDWFDPFVDEINREKKGRAFRLNYAGQQLDVRSPEEAEPLFEGLIRDYPDWDQAWLAYGRLLLKSQAYLPASDALSKAVSLAPDSVDGHFYLGSALFQRGEWRQAATQFREVTRVKPDHALAYNNLGHCLLRLNDHPAAMEAFRAAVRAKPTMAVAHTNLGKLLAEQGNKKAAIEELSLALELNPEDPEARKALDQLQPAQ